MIDIPEGYELVPNVPQNNDYSFAIPEGYELVSAPTIKTVARPSIMQQIGSNIDNTQSEATNAGIRLANKQQGLPESIAQGLSQGIGIIGDIAGPFISTGLKGAYNELTTQGFKDRQNLGLKTIANTDIGQSGLNELQNVRQHWNQYEQRDPAGAADLKALGTALTLGTGKSIVNATGELGNIVSKIPNISKDLGGALEKYGVETPSTIALSTIALPKELQSLDSLVKATKPTVFSKAPNSLQEGLNANQSISRSYDAAKERTYLANTAAREAGNTPIPAEDVYNKLNKITSSLEGKVAPGTKEASALDQLTLIRDNLNTKNPKMPSSAGEKISERTILPSDLMDIEKTINAGLPDNKFITSGSGKSLNFKKTIQDALQRAGETNSDFGQKYKNYKLEATNLMKTFVDNDSLKPFWQPEDHISWKSNQNNPEMIAYSDATKTRANNILNNLNTKDLGKISAVINALPKEEANKLMRNAYVKAKKDDINFTNALLSLADLNPVRGLGNAITIAGKSLAKNEGASDLIDTARDLKLFTKKRIRNKREQ